MSSMQPGDTGCLPDQQQPQPLLVGGTFRDVSTGQESLCCITGLILPDADTQ